MKRITPNYYAAFRCIGSACTDNCCIGWEIDIDDQSHAYYQRVPGVFGERLRDAISQDTPPHFLLRQDRCPFLNTQNLCDIFQNLGEEHLCEICTEHPRFHEWFEDATESGLGLCCEAVGKLLFTQQERVTFVTETYTDADEAPPSALLTALRTARDVCYALVQDRKRPLADRMQRLLLFGEALQECLPDAPEALNVVIQHQQSLLAAQQPVTPHAEPPLPALCELLHFFEGLEANDTAWTERLAAMQDGLPQLLLRRAAYPADVLPCAIEYEQLLVYFLHRYFLKAVFDLDVLSKIHLTLCSYLLIRLIDLQDATPTLEHRIEAAKSYSKEIEYSQENLDALYAESCTNPLFSAETLLQLLIL